MRRRDPVLVGPTGIASTILKLYKIVEWKFKSTIAPHTEPGYPGRYLDTYRYVRTGVPVPTPDTGRKFIAL